MDAPGAADRHLERTYRHGVLVITLLGAAWRGITLAAAWHHRILFNDSLYYTVQAQENASGHWFVEPFQPGRPGAEHPPLTSLVLTPVSWLRHPEGWQRATMTLIGIATIPVLAAVARRVAGRRTALIAAAIAAAYPNLWISDALIMSETLTALLVGLALLAALAHLRRWTAASAALLGAVLGLAGLARAEVLLLVPLLALIGVRRGRWRAWLGRAAIVSAGAAVVIAPWIVWNTARFDRVVLMSTNEGTTLLGANCPDTYSGAQLGGWSLPCLVEHDPPAGESTAARSARRRHTALAYARAHATRLPVVVGARVLRTGDLYGLGDLVRGDVGEERPRWAVWTGIASWWVLAPLAAIGVWRTRRGARWVLGAPAICVGVVIVVFYGSHRLRLPLEPVVVVGAAAFLARRVSAAGSVSPT